MESIFRVSEDEIKKVRDIFGKSEEDLKQDVQILLEWLRQQPHLPDEEDEGRLERMLIKNKCRIEKTKEKLELYYTCKSKYPDIMDYYDVLGKQVQEAMEFIYIAPLSQLTPKLERVLVAKFADLSKFQKGHFNMFYHPLELSMIYDYSGCFICIFDWTGITFDILKQLDFNLLQQVITYGMNALSGRLSAVLYVNPPSYIDIFLKILKVVAKPKLYNTLRCLKSLEELQEYVPKEILPVEYGGNGRSFIDLKDEWYLELKKNARVLEELKLKKSNEALRTGPIKENELFGTDGTFKRLNLD